METIEESLRESSIPQQSITVAMRVLKAKGLVPTSRRIHELRHATAEAVHEAYIKDESVQNMSVRQMVQDTHTHELACIHSRSEVEIVGVTY